MKEFSPHRFRRGLAAAAAVLLVAAAAYPAAFAVQAAPEEALPGASDPAPVPEMPVTPPPDTTVPPDLPVLGEPVVSDPRFPTEGGTNSLPDSLPPESDTPSGDTPVESEPSGEGETSSAPSGVTSEFVSEPEDTEPGNDTSSEEEEPVSSRQQWRPAVSEAPTHPNTNVNTDRAEIDRVASQAAKAVSDPDLLESQDWSELMTSTPVSENPEIGGFNTPGTQSLGSAPASHSVGGVSWLLVVGIVLIVAGLVGIGYFVYSQFFSDDDLVDLDDYGPGGDIEFMDISSSSGAAPPPVPPKPAPGPRPGARSARPGPDPTAATAAIPAVKKEPPAPARREAPVRRAPEDPATPAPEDTLPKAQARPVRSAKKQDFDWEKFFNEGGDDE